MKKLSQMSLEELWNLFPIFLTEHQPQWADWFAEEKKTLERLLPANRLGIYHIGSTAVGGIWAKPIVDILVELPDGEAMHAAKERLCASGYLCMSDSGARVSLNKGYTEAGYAERVFHIHLRLRGDKDEVYFRDYLNAYPEAAREYEALKLELWKRYPKDRDRYTQEKSQFVRKYTRLAKRSALSEYGAPKKTVDFQPKKVL